MCAVGALPRVSPQPLSVANRSLQAFGGVSLSQPLGYRSFVGGKVVQNGGEECGNRAFHELSAAQTRMRGGGEGKEIFLFEPNSSGAPMHLDLTVFGGCVRIVPVHLLRLLPTSTMASGKATPRP